MDVRFSPYNSPFFPSGPPGVYWVGLEHQGPFCDAHVVAYHVAAAKGELGAFRMGVTRSYQIGSRWFVEVGEGETTRTLLCDQKMIGLLGLGKVAAPVTPPLSAMGGTKPGFTAHDGSPPLSLMGETPASDLGVF